MFSDTQPLFTFRGPFGVPVEVSPSIFILALIFVDFGASPQQAVYDVMFLLLVVLSIFAHEIGHAWGCLIQNVPVRRVVLYAGGGFCEHARSATPREEELIVAMGPIVNLALWAACGLIAPVIADPEIAWVFWALSWVNFFLAVMNLMPVMPLDGGKLFHLALLRVLPDRLALRAAGAVGLVVALAWVPAMLASFYLFGFLLFFMPSIALHWRMMRAA